MLSFKLTNHSSNKKNMPWYDAANQKQGMGVEENLLNNLNPHTSHSIQLSHPDSILQQEENAETENKKSYFMLIESLERSRKMWLTCNFKIVNNEELISQEEKETLNQEPNLLQHYNIKQKVLIQLGIASIEIGPHIFHNVTFYTRKLHDYSRPGSGVGRGVGGGRPRKPVTKKEKKVKEKKVKIKVKKEKPPRPPKEKKVKEKIEKPKKVKPPKKKEPSPPPTPYSKDPFAYPTYYSPFHPYGYPPPFYPHFGSYMGTSANPAPPPLPPQSGTTVQNIHPVAVTSISDTANESDKITKEVSDDHLTTEKKPFSSDVVTDISSSSMKSGKHAQETEISKETKEEDNVEIVTSSQTNGQPKITAIEPASQLLSKPVLEDEGSTDAKLSSSTVGAISSKPIPTSTENQGDATTTHSQTTYHPQFPSHGYPFYFPPPPPPNTPKTNTLPATSLKDASSASVITPTSQNVTTLSTAETPANAPPYPPYPHSIPPYGVYPGGPSPSHPMYFPSPYAPFPMYRGHPMIGKAGYAPGSNTPTVKKERKRKPSSSAKSRPSKSRKKGDPSQKETKEKNVTNEKSSIQEEVVQRDETEVNEEEKKENAAAQDTVDGNGTNKSEENMTYENSKNDGDVDKAERMEDIQPMQETQNVDNLVLEVDVRKSGKREDAVLEKEIDATQKNNQSLVGESDQSSSRNNNLVNGSKEEEMIHIEIPPSESINADVSNTGVAGRAKETQIDSCVDGNKSGQNFTENQACEGTISNQNTDEMSLRINNEEEDAELDNKTSQTLISNDIINDLIEKKVLEGELSSKDLLSDELANKDIQPKEHLDILLSETKNKTEEVLDNDVDKVIETELKEDTELKNKTAPTNSAETSKPKKSSESGKPKRRKADLVFEFGESKNIKFKWPYDSMVFCHDVNRNETEEVYEITCIILLPEYDKRVKNKIQEPIIVTIRTSFQNISEAFQTLANDMSKEMLKEKCANYEANRFTKFDYETQVLKEECEKELAPTEQPQLRNLRLKQHHNSSSNHKTSRKLKSKDSLSVKDQNSTEYSKPFEIVIDHSHLNIKMITDSDREVQLNCESFPPENNDTDSVNEQQVQSGLNENSFESIDDELLLISEADDDEDEQGNEEIISEDENDDDEEAEAEAVNNDDAKMNIDLTADDTTVREIDFSSIPLSEIENRLRKKLQECVEIDEQQTD